MRTSCFGSSPLVASAMGRLAFGSVVTDWPAARRRPKTSSARSWAASRASTRRLRSALSAAGSVQVGRAVGARFMVEGRDEDRLHVVFGSVHDPPRSGGLISISAPQCSVIVPGCAIGVTFFSQRADR